MQTRFKELTGRKYEKSQFKNKYDSMRKDWTTWHKLLHETGVGQDSEKHIVAATDDLSAAGKGRVLFNNTATLIRKFLWEEILCRYGAVGQITIDNGPEVQAAVTHLMN